jgi:hypothetical protein
MDLDEVRMEMFNKAAKYALDSGNSGEERMKMYSVVEYTNGEETSVSEAKPYQDAYADYETKSAIINAVDEKGSYKHPKKRVSLRVI